MAATLLGIGVSAANESSRSMVSIALPPAHTWTVRGLDPRLRGARGPTRVMILLRKQPLLRAAARPRNADQLLPVPESNDEALDHPGRITGVEKASANDAEASYEAGIEGLQQRALQAGGHVDDLTAQIRRLGGRIVSTEIAPASIEAVIPGGSTDEIVASAEVQAVDKISKETRLAGSGYEVVGAPAWWADGHTGGAGDQDTVPADAGVTDELPDPAHPAFASLEIDNSPTDPVNDHGMHTAGVLASQDGTYRGVAYGLDRMVNGGYTYILGLPGNGNSGAEDPAEVANHSFGTAATTENEPRSIGDDLNTAVFGLSQAFGAGNDGELDEPAVANIGRNTMSVAGFDSAGTVSPTDDEVMEVSSRGPTPGGRKKPDLAAPGMAITGPSIHWDTRPPPPCGSVTLDPDGTCADFTNMSGTSFAAPHVAGAMTLLEGAGITDPMAQRAILINSARDWSGTDVGLEGWAAPQTGWRPEVGWGQLDLTAALAQRGYYELGSVPEGEAAFYRATVPPGAKATMAFQLRGFFTNFGGPPGTIGTMVYTQSNLDLHQYRADGSEVASPPAFDPPATDIDPGPDAIDSNDTVEQVRAPSGGTQEITYKVQSASEIDGASAEPFAVAAAAELTPLESPTVRPDTQASAERVSCSTPVTITTTLGNDSDDLNATSAAVGIELSSGLSLVSGPPVQMVSGGTLESDSSSEAHTWTIAATSEGAKTVTITGVGEAYDTQFRREDTVTFDADCTPPSTVIDAAPTAMTNDSSPTFEFSGQGGAASFECAVNSGAFSPCSSPHQLGPLEDDLHTFAVRARDAVGNVDPSPATRAFQVDTKPPGTTIVRGPKAVTSRPAAVFGFVSHDGTEFECSMDGRPFDSCASPSRFGGLGEGDHRFRVAAIDAAGNRDASPAARGFRVDSSVSRARLRAGSPQRFDGQLRVKTVARLGERGRVTVRARIEIGERAVRSRTASLSLRPNREERIVLSAGRRSNRAIRRALALGVVEVTIKARFVDRLGNRRTVPSAIRLLSE